MARLRRADPRAREPTVVAGARAGQVLRHLQRQPRRLLSGSGREPQDAAGGRPSLEQLGGRDHFRTADEDQRSRPRARRQSRSKLRLSPRTGSGRSGHPTLGLGRSRRRGSGDSRPFVRRGALSCADAAGCRSGASVSVHLQPVAQPRGRRPSAGRADAEDRARQGAAVVAALLRAPGWRAVRRAGAADRAASVGSFPRHGRRRALAFPSDA